MKKIKRKPTVDELINLSLTNILNNLKYLNPNGKGVRVAYYGRFEDLRKDCQRIINVIESQGEDNE